MGTWGRNCREDYAFYTENVRSIWRRGFSVRCTSHYALGIIILDAEGRERSHGEYFMY